MDLERMIRGYKECPKPDDGEVLIRELHRSGRISLPMTIDRYTTNMGDRYAWTHRMTEVQQLVRPVESTCMYSASFGYTASHLYSSRDSWGTHTFNVWFNPGGHSYVCAHRTRNYMADAEKHFEAKGRDRLINYILRRFLTGLDMEGNWWT